MTTQQQSNCSQADARVEIGRIAAATSETIMMQQVAYASGYIRALCDRQLIAVGVWHALAVEIDAVKTAWTARHGDTQVAIQDSAQIELASAEKTHK